MYAILGNVPNEGAFCLARERSRQERLARHTVSICRSRRRIMLVAAELTCECALVREHTRTRAAPDRDARQANIMCAAWRVDSREAVARMVIDSECEAAASAGPAVARGPRAARTRDRPEWWSGTRYAPPESSGHSALLGVSGSRECCMARRNRSRARWHILCNAVPCRCTCNITIFIWHKSQSHLGQRNMIFKIRLLKFSRKISKSRASVLN